MIYEIKFLIALLLTVFLETPVVFITLKYFYKNKEKTFRIIISSIIASSLTLPYLWFIIPFFIKDYIVYIIIGEIFVVLIEGFFYSYIFNIKIIKGIVISLLSNLFSLLLGYNIIKLF